MEGAQQVMAHMWHEGMGYLILLLVFMSLFLLRVRQERRTLYNTLAFFVFSMAGLFVSGLMHVGGLTEPAATLRGLFIIAEGLAVIRLAGLFLFHVLLPLGRLTPPSILEDMLVIAGYLLWGMYRLHETGVELSSLVTTSAVITAVLAFSMQDTLGNILGGIALQLDSSIKLGDWIKVDDSVGRIVDIRWRSTSIETRNWETVVIPNSVLMKNKFQVLGRRQDEPVQWRRWVWFNVDYDIPPAKVIHVVEAAIRGADIPNVAQEPEPNCVMMDFADSTGRYALRYWLTDLARDDPTDSAVRVHLYAALKRAGIYPAWPRQTIHMVKEGGKQEARRQARYLGERIDVLQQLELFSELNDEELSLTAEHLIYAPFAAGDVITRQGDRAHWLYILVEGEAEVVLEAPGQPRRVLNTIHEGESGSFFGEMGLLTGEPRTASVMARTDVLCYRLDKSGFEDIIHARPAIAEEISAIMAERRMALSSAQQQLDEDTRKRRMREDQNDVLRRIRNFFNL
jgi:small-conductance mechanosensitive channel/CRP-like cAMP-binding protein